MAITTYSIYSSPEKTKTIRIEYEQYTSAGKSEGEKLRQ